MSIAIVSPEAALDQRLTPTARLVLLYYGTAEKQTGWWLRANARRIARCISTSFFPITSQEVAIARNLLLTLGYLERAGSTFLEENGLVARRLRWYYRCVVQFEEKA